MGVLIVMPLADRLKQLRDEAGLTQLDLANRTSNLVTPATISRIETGGIQEPGKITLKRLAEALGVSVSYLIGDDDSAPATRSDVRLEGVDVNLLAIKELDPEEFELIAAQLAARREKLERERKEMRNAERRRRAAAKQTGQTDSEEETSRG